MAEKTLEDSIKDILKDNGVSSNIDKISNDILVSLNLKASPCPHCGVMTKYCMSDNIFVCEEYDCMGVPDEPPTTNLQ